MSRLILPIIGVAVAVGGLVAYVAILPNTTTDTVVAGDSLEVTTLAQEEPENTENPNDNVEQTSEIRFSEPTNPNTSADILQISDFNVFGSPNEGRYQVRFSLLNDRLEQVGEGGHVLFRLLDEQGNELYTNSVDIYKHNFEIWEVGIYRNEVLAYVSAFPASEVKKGVGAWGVVA